MNDRPQPAPPDAERLAALGKALAHPVRVQILAILARRGACVCGDLVELLPVAQSTVSEHLRILKVAGLVRGEIEGPRRCYCVDTGVLAELEHAVRALSLAAESCCGARPELETKPQRP